MIIPGFKKITNLVIASGLDISPFKIREDVKAALAEEREARKKEMVRE